MLGCSIEEILCNVNDTGIWMVRFAHKPIHDGFYYLTSNHVVKDEQMTDILIGHQFLIV
jgi:hypothetical protein